MKADGPRSTRQPDLKHREAIGRRSSVATSLGPMELAELVAAVDRIVGSRGSRARLSNLDRQDLAQQVLEQYLRVWRNGAEPDNVAAWIETATRNALVNRIRDDRNKPALRFGQGEDEPVALAVAALRADSTSAIPVAVDLERRVRAGLKPDEITLFDLVLQEMSDKRIAEELRIEVANAKKRRQRLLAKLRATLEADPTLLEALRASHPHVYPDAQWRQGRPN